MAAPIFMRSEKDEENKPATRRMVQIIGPQGEPRIEVPEGDSMIQQALKSGWRVKELWRRHPKSQ